MRGIVLKSHHYITTPVTAVLEPMVPGIELYGGVSLDEDVGGLNPIVVDMAGKIGSKMIWLPTFTARCDVRKKGGEGGISLFDDSGALLPVVTEILELVKQHDMTLATGHISTPEIFALLKAARTVGVTRIVVNHPLSVSFGCNATVAEQKQMAEEGALIEHCFIATMPASDRLSPAKIAEAVRTIGAEHCLMATDFGQLLNPAPVEGMRMYIQTMLHYGLTADEIVRMVRVNPARILGLPD